jgi:hypothetical protein
VEEPSQDARHASDDCRLLRDPFRVEHLFSSTQGVGRQSSLTLGFAPVPLQGTAARLRTAGYLRWRVSLLRKAQQRSGAGLQSASRMVVHAPISRCKRQAGGLTTLSGGTPNSLSFHALSFSLRWFLCVSMLNTLHTNTPITRSSTPPAPRLTAHRRTAPPSPRIPYPFLFAFTVFSGTFSASE